GKKVVRFAVLTGMPETLIDQDLEDPRHLAFDANGNILVSDRGTSHLVKIFSAEGKKLRQIGVPGAPWVAAYHPDHMNKPNGRAADWRDRLWVAEADNFPRRVSLWAADGKLIRAFYGPTEYGGGGMLDPKDATRFFYKGLEFKLDWKAGTDTLTRVYARP